MDKGGEPQGEGKDEKGGDEDKFARDVWTSIGYVRDGEEKDRSGKPVERAESAKHILSSSMFP